MDPEKQEKLECFLRFKHDNLIKPSCLQIIITRYEKITKEAGILAFYEIGKKLKSEGWIRKFDKKQRVPFAFNDFDDQLVSYDDVKSLGEKVY